MYFYHMLPAPAVGGESVSLGNHTAHLATCHYGDLAISIRLTNRSYVTYVRTYMVNSRGSTILNIFYHFLNLQFEKLFLVLFVIRLLVTKMHTHLYSTLLTCTLGFTSVSKNGIKLCKTMNDINMLAVNPFLCIDKHI